MIFRFYSPLQLHCRWKTRKYRTVGGRYRLIRQMGRGSSGLVHLALDIKTNEHCAVKELCKFVRTEKKRKTTKTVNEESRIMKGLKHDNIIQLKDVIEDADSIFLVMELAHQVIMDIVPHATTQPYSNQQCKRYFEQILDSVDYLHQRGVIHGDIKSENIMLTNQNTVKLIDFGNAAHISDMERRAVGSPAFMAPELLKKVAHSPTTPDLWALGVTLYCLAYGHLPFEKRNFLQLYQDILHSS
ncbi:kinase-like domain-containing protein [Sporodiniella umbellata]|nr:kinase-like domain-containing protein [Sporodiniella umbellata]